MNKNADFPHQFSRTRAFEAGTVSEVSDATRSAWTSRWRFQLPNEQAPATQVRPDGHARPHAPQCALLVCVLTSQPLLALPSQSPEPRAHVVGWRAQRKPVSEARYPVPTNDRSVARTLMGFSVYQLPPRLTRSVPAGVPTGSVTYDVASPE